MGAVKRREDIRQMPRPLIPGFLATGQTCALPAQAAESIDIVEITAALGLAKPLLQGVSLDLRGHPPRMSRSRRGAEPDSQM
jgi:hypothetical protein